MLALYKTRFRIEPKGSESCSEVAMECLRYLETWVEQSSKKSRVAYPGVERVAEIVPARKQPQLHCARLESGAFLHSFVWRRASDDNPPMDWVTLIHLVSDGTQLEFQLQLGVEAETTTLGTRRPSPGRPRLIPTLISHPRWLCRSGDQELSVLPRLVAWSEVEEFCEETLLSDDRELPAVVITPISRTGTYPVEPRMLAERLGGTARVFEMRDPLAAVALDQFLGRSLAVGLDAVRVFGPGLQGKTGLEGNWHFRGDKLRAESVSTVDFSNFLFGRLAERGLARFRESPLIAAFRHLADQERARKLAVARAEQLKNEEFFEDYARTLEDQVRQLESEKRYLEDQLARSEEDREQLRGELETARENLSLLSRELGRPELEWAEPRAEEAPARSVDRIVASAADECSDLHFLESAFRSADEVPKNFNFPERAAEAIRALQDGAHERRQRGRIEGGWRQFFERRGFEYKAVLSDTTRNAWGSEYSFPYEGRRELFEEHFTIGSKSANTCLSIHFSTRLRDDKIVVAYVGRHLRNTQT